MERELIIEALLMALLGESSEEDWSGAAADAGVEPFESGDPVHSSHSFETEGVLTTNRGVVLRLVDGSEYQITIVPSRNPH